MILEAGLTPSRHGNELYTGQSAKNTARALLPVCSQDRVLICQHDHLPIRQWFTGQSACTRFIAATKQYCHWAYILTTVFLLKGKGSEGGANVAKASLRFS